VSQALSDAERRQFVPEYAGPEAAASYEAVIALRTQGLHDQAEQRYPTALQQKDTLLGLSVTPEYYIVGVLSFDDLN
jgi:hypothetical protein